MKKCCLKQQFFIFHDDDEVAVGGGGGVKFCFKMGVRFMLFQNTKCALGELCAL